MNDSAFNKLMEEWKAKAELAVAQKLVADVSWAKAYANGIGNVKDRESAADIAAGQSRLSAGVAIVEEQALRFTVERAVNQARGEAREPTTLEQTTSERPKAPAVEVGEALAAELAKRAAERIERILRAECEGYLIDARGVTAHEAKEAAPDLVGRAFGVWLTTGVPSIQALLFSQILDEMRGGLKTFFVDDEARK